MTEQPSKTHRVKCLSLRKEAALRISSSEAVTLLLSSVLLWYVFYDPKGGIDAAYTGLLLAGKTVLPSLFPFLVLSSLIVKSGVGDRLSHVFSRPMQFLFGISGKGASAFLLGAFCGFPVGAKAVSELYGSGAISKSEAERLLPLSNSPSFAFLFSAVGAGLFGDSGFGLTLYLSVLLSTVLTGILCRLLCGKCASVDPADTERASPPRLSETVVSAVTGAAQSMLTVTAFVVFFSVLSEALSVLLLSLGAPSSVTPLLSGLLELSRGTKNAAETVTGLCGRVLCGFFAGYGGLSAHLQVIATAERPLPDRARRKSLSFRSYFIQKFVQGLLTALFVWILSRIL